jgi:hypothetical protein
MLMIKAYKPLNFILELCSLKFQHFGTLGTKFLKNPTIYK